MDSLQKDHKPIIGITQGDINGISYEIILKSLKEYVSLEKLTPVIYGSPKVAAYFKKVFEIEDIELMHVPSVDHIDRNAINIINCTNNKVKVEIGKSTDLAGEAAFDALKTSLEDIKKHKLDALITAPINKANIKLAGFEFTGHTDYYKNAFNAEDVLMLMICDELKITLVSEHIPVKDISAFLTKEKVLSKLRLLKHTLQRDFCIAQPRIAVLGLNPHCGDNGVIGNEDDTIIYPAIEEAQKENILAFGPFSADGFFGYESFVEYDAVLAMYHDQGLTPFKLLAKGGGTNFTAGLPIVRTSPAHGTAYEIAGRNQASIKSFIDTIDWTTKIIRNRMLFDNTTPLKTDSSQHQLETQ